MFQIKQAALLSGFTVDTLRFYDKQALAKPSCRSGSGYRLYSDDDITRLRFIKRAKDVGFSLDGVRELLDMRLNKSKKSCEDVKSVTQKKLAEVDNKINELKTIKNALKCLHENCCGGPVSAEHCTILQALEAIGGKQCH